jgi:hypothetical protein
VPTQDIFVPLAALVGPEENIFFVTVYYFNSFVPVAPHAGSPVS